MKAEKYSPNWLLQKIESSKTDAHKLLHIIEFQNQLIKELKQGQSLPIDIVMPCGDCSTKTSPCRTINCQYSKVHKA